jgi:hypothetical protein
LAALQGQPTLASIVSDSYQPTVLHDKMSQFLECGSLSVLKPDLRNVNGKTNVNADFTLSVSYRPCRHSGINDGAA